MKVFVDPQRTLDDEKSGERSLLEEGEGEGEGEGEEEEANIMLLMKTSVLNITRITIRALQTARPVLLLPRSRIKEQAASFTTMGLPAVSATHASLRVDRIGGHLTELLEVHAERPAFQVLFIPGNPGVVAYYQEYLEALYDYLDGRASITGLGARQALLIAGPSRPQGVVARRLVRPIVEQGRNWERGKFLIHHNGPQIQFVRELLIKDAELPLLLVGHSIGAYITMEIYKRFPSKVQHVIGLYPFVTLNTQSKWQLTLRRITETSALCKLVSNFAGLVRHFPQGLSRGLVKILLGREWGSLAVDVTCQYLLQSTAVHNYMYMGRTEFATLPTELDWDFLRGNERQISFLFGSNDHWGPLSLLQQISKEIPQLNVATEREGHLHAFCCSKAGSDWVAHYTADTILSRTSCAQL